MAEDNINKTNRKNERKARKIANIRKNIITIQLHYEKSFREIKVR